MISISSRTQLYLLEFIDRKALKTEIGRLEKHVKGKIGLGKTAPSEQVAAELKNFFAGQSADFATPLAYTGTASSVQMVRSRGMVAAYGASKS